MPVSYDLSGRTAVVTGGSNGIGRAIAEQLTGSGAQTWVWDIAPPQGLDEMGFAAVDVTNSDQIARAIKQVLAGASGIDILVNNAGFTGDSSSVEEIDPVQWRRVVEVNLTGVFEVSRQVVPVMRRSGWGRIVNIASLAGKEGTPNLSAYSAAKAGVIAFTKSLAKELADTSIRVNSVAPAAIKTDILEQMAPEMVETMIAKSPMKRLGTVNEVADLVLWLCSEACSFNTGAVFDLSGGRATY
ncbi:SDR family NAD(P)-dependent oxidoreductase [Microvirga massiliensis]|uniref:SDR family NAD(P)-dependent oxidoreductase n=1 Tax=Microvirga massiliensis TaxID=1033741 RepID=UPI00062BA9FA|nr:SDR family NAD(P)-dependent oxidoreductase [Microvirga massiliensis]